MLVQLNWWSLPWVHSDEGYRVSFQVTLGTMVCVCVCVCSKGFSVLLNKGRIYCWQHDVPVLFLLQESTKGGSPQKDAMGNFLLMGIFQSNIQKGGLVHQKKLMPLFKFLFPVTPKSNYRIICDQIPVSVHLWTNAEQSNSRGIFFHVVPRDLPYRSIAIIVGRRKK